MRTDSRPTTFSINLPSLPYDAVIEIQDFLFEILELFETYYARSNAFSMITLATISSIPIRRPI